MSGQSIAIGVIWVSFAVVQAALAWALLRVASDLGRLRRVVNNIKVEYEVSVEDPPCGRCGGSGFVGFADAELHCDVCNRGVKECVAPASAWEARLHHLEGAVAGCCGVVEGERGDAMCDSFGCVDVRWLVGQVRRLEFELKVARKVADDTVSKMVLMKEGRYRECVPAQDVACYPN